MQTIHTVCNVTRWIAITILDLPERSISRLSVKPFSWWILESKELMCADWCAQWISLCYCFLSSSFFVNRDVAHVISIQWLPAPPFGTSEFRLWVWDFCEIPWSHALPYRLNMGSVVSAHMFPIPDVSIRHYPPNIAGTERLSKVTSMFNILCHENHLKMATCRGRNMSWCDRREH
jgi:hypothetical protein